LNYSIKNIIKPISIIGLFSILSACGGGDYTYIGTPEPETPEPITPPVVVIPVP
jgi:acyl-homoserine-lactone acylase